MTAEEYKSIREKLGLTQAGLAARLGVTRKTINGRENGAKITEEARLAILSFSSPNTQAQATQPLHVDQQAPGARGINGLFCR